MADLIEPLYQRMGERVRESHVVAIDDTILPMQSVGKTQPTRMWVTRKIPTTCSISP